MMKVISDIAKHEKKIKSSISKFGYCAEHNYMHYFYMQNAKEKNAVFDFGKDKLLLANVNNKNKWFLFPNGILAPKNERYSLLKKFLDYALIKMKTKKIFVEADEELRREILNKLKNSKKYRACSYAYILYWPLYNMSKFDDKLRGKEWKKLRNIKNRFYKQHKIKVVDSKKVPKEELKKILDMWLRKRQVRERVKKQYYANLIESNFKGTDMAKTLIVDGKPCSITAGWKIPNSNNYYSHVGILDYSHEGLGEVANIIDLKQLKRKNYEYADFGGSTKALLYFKKKFKPERIYKTYVFSIVRR